MLSGKKGLRVTSKAFCLAEKFLEILALLLVYYDRGQVVRLVYRVNSIIVNMLQMWAEHWSDHSEW